MARFKNCQMCGRTLLSAEAKNSFCPECMDAMRHKLPNIASVRNPPHPTEVQTALKEVRTEVLAKQMSDKEETKDMKSVKVPKKGAVPPASVTDVTMDTVAGMNLADLMSKSPWGDLPPTQQKIHEIMGAMKDLLLYKNQKYGDSAINPKKIFYKGDSTNSILIRLDDKIGRVMSNTEEKPRINDVCDIIGYCALLLISMGVTAEDIAKFKD